MTNDLVAAEVERHLLLRRASLGAPVTVSGETGSTNDDARRAAAEGAPHGAAFLADSQTAGRGRGDHAWHSPPGENLYLSVVLRPRAPAAEIASFTLVVGLAVATVVERRLAREARAGQVRIKWPNDVLVDGRKIAGVLCEAQLRGGQVSSLVVGVGLDVRTTRFPDALAGRATSLALLGCSALDRSEIAAELLANLGELAREHDRAGLAASLSAIEARDALLGRPVTVEGQPGVAAGIDAEGRLLVRAADGVVRPVSSGEIIEVAPGACAAGEAHPMLGRP